MNPKNTYASNYARLAANKIHSNGTEHPKLSAQMCWDAVKYCAVIANIISEEESRVLSAKTCLVNRSDKIISTPQQMSALPAGYAIGFFEKDTIIHAMISTGRGLAAGNKNSCVGVGKDIGWELLDLEKGLNWRTDGKINIPRGIGKNNTMVYAEAEIHARLLSDLKR